LLGTADVPRVNSLRASSQASPSFVPGDEIALFPLATGDDPASQTPAQPAHPSSKNATLDDQAKLDLVRYVSGEFARALKDFPAGKDGFIINVGKPINDELLQRAVATHGIAVHSGDNVQITKLEFHEHQIIVDLNGGGRGKKRLRDRIHFEVGGIPTVTTST